jgi:PadR family transcriptional regulator, regulatory protein AphA
MSLDYILLGLLRQPASGYDLKAVFDQQIHYFWAAELSQIYPTLQRLEAAGRLRSRSAGSRRGPARRVYEVTAAGRRALREWLEVPPELNQERNPYLAQLFFMGELADLRKTERYFVRLRDQIAARHEALQRIERLWSAADSGFPDRLPVADFHVFLTLRKGLYSLRAHLDWCDDSLKRIRERVQREEAPAAAPVRKRR